MCEIVKFSFEIRFGCEKSIGAVCRILQVEVHIHMERKLGGHCNSQEKVDGKCGAMDNRYLGLKSMRLSNGLDIVGQKEGGV